jgi:hypothetical protein
MTILLFLSGPDRRQEEDVDNQSACYRYLDQVEDKEDDIYLGQVEVKKDDKDDMTSLQELPGPGRRGEGRRG